MRMEGEVTPPIQQKLFFFSGKIREIKEEAGAGENKILILILILIERKKILKAAYDRFIFVLPEHRLPQTD